MFRVQYLSDRRIAETLVDTRHARPGAVWVNVGSSTKRRAKAERTLRNLRIDRPDAIVRLHEVRR